MKVGSRFTDRDGNKMIAIHADNCSCSGCKYDGKKECESMGNLACHYSETEDDRCLIFIIDTKVDKSVSK